MLHTVSHLASQKAFTFHIKTVFLFLFMSNFYGIFPKKSPILRYFERLQVCTYVYTISANKGAIGFEMAYRSYFVQQRQ